MRLVGAGLVCRTVAHVEVATGPHVWLTEPVLLGHLVVRHPFTGVDLRLYRVG